MKKGFVVCLGVVIISTVTANGTPNFHDVDAFKDTDVWFVGGTSTTPYALHYNGSSIDREDYNFGGTDSIFAITLMGDGTIWGTGGDGWIWFFNGSSWSTDPYHPTGESYYGIAHDGTTVYRVGNSAGASIDCYSGGTWSNVPGITGNILTDVDIKGGFGIAVGFDGEFYTYSSGTWTQQSPIASLNFYGCAVFNSTNCWAVGDNGKIYRYNGSTWTESTNPASTSLSGVCANGPESALISGDGGLIMYYDDGTYAVGTTPTTEDLRMAIKASGAYPFYACGFNGVMLEHKGPPEEWVLIDYTSIEPSSFGHIKANFR